MGEMAEYYREAEMLAELEEEVRRKREPRIGTGAGEGEWVTKNRRILKISSMTNSHLANALALMRREEPENPKIREVLAEMLRRSSQMAADGPVKW